MHSYIDTGVDAIKFQTHIAESSEYEDNTRYDYWKGIKKHCDDVGLEFISSPFSNMAVDW